MAEQAGMPAITATFSAAQLADGTLQLTLAGRLDAYTLAHIWPQALAALPKAATPICVEASAVSYCDGAGAAFLADLASSARHLGAPFSLTGLAEHYAGLVAALGDAADDAPAVAHTPKPKLVAEIGQNIVHLAADVRAQLAYLGAVLVALWKTLFAGQRLRWSEIVDIAEQTGIKAIPIVCLIAFLMGVILAFQSAVPMRQFGAEIFVADLVGLSMLRELGPLMTAVVLAGRTGAAFAAEIGTMRVNDEVDALVTMGLDPVRFLVLPRVLATVFVTPLLTVFADAVGLLGGGLVMQGFNIPLVSYIHQITNIATIGDFAGGIFKSLVFALLVSGVGCLRGLEAKTGPSAVGLAATRAVVSGILLIVLADGLFAMLFNQLGI